MAIWSTSPPGTLPGPADLGLSLTIILTAMARSNENTRRVRFSMEVNRRLEHLSPKLGRTKLLFLIKMFNYFNRIKKDTADLNDGVLKNELYSGVYFPFSKSRNPVSLSSYVPLDRRANRPIIKIICKNRRVYPEKFVDQSFFEEFSRKFLKKVIIAFQYKSEKSVFLLKLV
ncbi:hypothetical protein [Sphingobacterium multivorum]|uniref:hypothetical protein n=1 Tax=Sphingobacterium multivorum TaxID=28454 RepID=UPI0028B0CF45|nr:hypothetical protein [Sphingobacterium multivorum]